MLIDLKPDVTVIVATYNRPDALRFALRSVQWQTHEHWAVLVVGDQCDSRTQDVMDEFLSDARFMYVNLTQRCQEQAIPNSAAMRVAGTEFIALLNHDDIWLPDHLEIALEALRRKEADLFVGRASAGRELAEGAAGSARRLIFARANPPTRRWLDAFGDVFDVFEPASAWVFTRRLANRVGAWRPAASLFRLPLQDWLLRAWRAEAKMVSDRRITCLKLETQWGKEVGERNYESPVTGHEYLNEQISRKLELGQPLRTEDGAVPDLDLEQPFVRRHRLLRHESALARGMERWLRCSLVARLYRVFGWDAYGLCCQLLNVPRGGLIRWSLTKRTGETLRAPPPLGTVVAQLFDARRTRPNWTGWA